MGENRYDIPDIPDAPSTKDITVCPCVCHGLANYLDIPYRFAYRAFIDEPVKEAFRVAQHLATRRIEYEAERAGDPTLPRYEMTKALMTWARGTGRYRKKHGVFRKGDNDGNKRRSRLLASKS